MTTGRTVSGMCLGSLDVTREVGTEHDINVILAT